MILSLFRLLLFFCLINLMSTEPTSADISVSKSVNNNEWGVTTLAFSSRDTASDQKTGLMFNVIGLKPGGYQVRALRLKNDGEMNINYSIGTNITSEEKILCESLNIKILENWQTRYSGKIVDLNIEGEINTESGNDWVIVVGLDKSDVGLKGKSCSFSFVFKSISKGLSDEAVVENQVSSGVWE